MKKTWGYWSGLFLVVLLLTGVSAQSCSDNTDAELQTMETQSQITTSSVSSVPVPTVTYFQERKTISKWTKRFDQPNVTTYVYIISFGNVLGYYVADGKPASTRSYLLPEEKLIEGDAGEYSGDFIMSAPDIDGTYGDNNPGIRFFTASGTAVEWAGSGASYIYSDYPLPLNVPCLGK